MESNFFIYLSMLEGLVIVCMLGWEVFWLRKMYQVLWRMPTSDQIKEMVDMIKDDRESIKTSLMSLTTVFEPLKNVFSMGSISSLFGGQKIEK